MLRHQICNIFLPRKCELFINRRYISRFAVVPLCFDHSMDFKIPQAHLVVSLTEPPFFSNTLGDLDYNTPVCTAMAVFLVIALPATRILCRIILLLKSIPGTPYLDVWECLGCLIFSVDLVSLFTYLARCKLRQARTASLLTS